jgi:L-threonylcarbamoyladenylate synthase
MALAAAFWPGPLTLVLPRQPAAPLAAAVSAGLQTVAVRVPAHPVMQALLRAVAFPLAAPSANRSGAISPTSAAHVVASLGSNVDFILDGGITEQGLESTIVAVRRGGGWEILRPGPIEEGAIAAIIGGRSDELNPNSPKIEAPGQLDSHYAPGKPLRLEACQAEPGEFLIGFGAVSGAVSLSPSGDPAEAAARLYACLHLAAAAPERRIAVAPIPEGGIGAAINDRLRRAAV